MAAPIAAIAFEVRVWTSWGSSSERSATGIKSVPATAVSIIPAASLAAAQAVAAGLPSAPRLAAPPVERPDVLPATLRGPVNPYEAKAGTIIPAVLLTGVKSDLPGQLIGQVDELTFDTEAGQYLRVRRDGDPGPGIPETVRRHGASLKLKPVQTYPAALLKGRVPGELHTALTAHTRLPRHHRADDRALALGRAGPPAVPGTRIGTSRRGDGGPKTGPWRDRRRASDETGENEAGGRGGW